MKTLTIDVACSENYFKQTLSPEAMTGVKVEGWSSSLSGGPGETGGLDGTPSLPTISSCTTDKTSITIYNNDYRQSMQLKMHVYSMRQWKNMGDISTEGKRHANQP